MAGFDKVVSSYEAAMEGLKDGDTIIAGGFGFTALASVLTPSSILLRPEIPNLTSFAAMIAFLQMNSLRG